MFHYLTSELSFETIYNMDERKKKLLKAKISLALLDELGRRPTEQEIERYFLAARVLYKAVLGLHFERRDQKKNGQIPLF
jgi:hypothetical protein